MPLSAASAATVTLAWDQNSEPDIAGYKIHYGASSGAYDSVSDVGNHTSCTISGLAEGTAYYFAATAYNTNNIESSLSEEIAYTIPVSTSPSTPPPVDSDGDGILDTDETDVYGTDPGRADTDGDGINDGAEIALWGNDWDADFDNDSLINLLDPDSDNDGYPDGSSPEPLAPPPASTPESKPSYPVPAPALEIGEVRIDHNWQYVQLKNSYVNPVVIARSLSLNGSDPAVIRIQHLDEKGFEIRVQEWDYLDGSHVEESVSYLVMESGSHILENGTKVEAGMFESNKTKGYQSISFSRSFQKIPVVITSILSINEADAVTGRIRSIDTQGFTFLLQEQERNRRKHTSETVAYIAWEPSMGAIDGLSFEINKTGNSVADSFYTIQFAQNFINTPMFIAEMQTGNGMNTASVRWQNKDAYAVEVQIDEEQSRDRETYHCTEVVGYMVFSQQ